MQHGHDRLEHLVAGGVAEGIVDRLQAIDVEHDQRAAGLIALDVGDRAIELALEAAPVGNIQQEIGIGERLQFSMRFCACANSVLSRRMVGLASWTQPVALTATPAGPSAGLTRGRSGRLARRATPPLRRFAGPEAVALVFFFMGIL